MERAGQSGTVALILLIKESEREPAVVAVKWMVAAKPPLTNDQLEEGENENVRRLMKKVDLIC